jgi:ribonuclease E
MDDIAAGGAGETGAAPESNTRTSGRSRSRRRTPEPVTDVIPGLEPELPLADVPAAPTTSGRGRRKATSRAASARSATSDSATSGSESSGPAASGAQPGSPAASEASAAEPAEAPVSPAKRTRRSTRAASTAAAASEPAPAESPAAPPASATPPSPPSPLTPFPAKPPAPVGASASAEPPAPPAPKLAPSTALLFLAPNIEPIRSTSDVAEEETGRSERRGRRDRRAAEPVGEVPALDLDLEEPPSRRRGRRDRAAEPPTELEEPEDLAAEEADLEEAEAAAEDAEEGEVVVRRRRRRGRRGRGRGRGVEVEEAVEAAAEEPAEDEEEEGAAEEETPTRRRRRRRRSGAATTTTVETETSTEDGVVTVVKVRPARDEVQGVSGSTRLEAKRQRRRDGREQRRTRPPILTEAEFLARRESVDRVMVVRQRGDRTQVAVLEDGILVEHYVARQSATTMVGNVYLGKVQNVLPSMEAAFVDIGRGRNAVLYAGEVNWDATGLEGRNRSIEQALKSGDSVLVQVTKDPVGHKGARLTSHIALSGRHLVYVPNGHASGISRKLSDVERRRLRDILKNLVPEGAGVIVRTAAEGASEEDLARDVKRLQAQWEDIQAKAAAGNAPALLSAEPDLVIRVVRDLFNEDFREIVIQGAEAHAQVEQYLSQVSPDLVSRVRQHTGPTDVFAEWRIDEQILKGLDRKVYLPSGGHLVIDRTEAMTVIDVNTGKYTGAGGNLEETVTRNNLEAAEEIVRQLRLRDIGGIIVIDFIDMVLESNRELVLRRLTECLGRDRTKHQVTEITSLGLVQMTRKRIGQGLLEAFSETCDHCKGRGVIIQTEPLADRARSSVAEKVRAVAASTRLAAAEAPGRVPVSGNGVGPTVEADGGAPATTVPAEPEPSANGVIPEPADASEVAAETELPEPSLADIDTDAVNDAADLALDLAEAGNGGAEEEAEATTARRRARRASARRRTRP